ncbi:hypothetical protein HBH56_158190 [Parastagonospora nodorum]|uniref:Uncharacterized protein n=1 Tax=Phaeosphaeria nodorum (strain SN15 / ATCC MYA-4574 / FGSC 10173) TaxID=321614 RepID=A0A7U2F2A0_PHANO|nr:hypothetical protein HBH56_158190 [Parastagonospora nodorum]QRC97405.1 hypothetical protein JI435_410530 [Parastagonospora nodorum SN15]KAH3922947.1 hypothetical protein HBH54_216550 [Parastagonospora nodorum]KAH3946886.1 hypothetical protein HBH53_123740 [Parastagonospora nodorum]KAH3969561.1 hypothetical protein HBH52_171750 [Parastagonospora nodorum]
MNFAKLCGQVTLISYAQNPIFLNPSIVPRNPTTSFLSIPSSSGLICSSVSSHGLQASPYLNCRASSLPTSPYSFVALWRSR